MYNVSDWPPENQQQNALPCALAAAVICSDPPRNGLHTASLPAGLHHIAEREISCVRTEGVATTSASVWSFGAKGATTGVTAVDATW